MLPCLTALLFPRFTIIQCFLLLMETFFRRVLVKFIPTTILRRLWILSLVLYILRSEMLFSL
jgi:hypothetical protein